MTYFDTEFDARIVIATVQCPGCGRRLRCSCPACMETWPETTNGPGIGFTVNVGDDHQKCNDCGHLEHIDGWAQIHEEEIEYGPLAASLIE